MNIGGDHPNQPLVLIIKPGVRAKFSFKPEEYLKRKFILVSGKLIDYKGRPQKIIKDPKQIEELSANDSRLNLKKVKKLASPISKFSTLILENCFDYL